MAYTFASSSEQPLDKPNFKAGTQPREHGAAGAAQDAYKVGTKIEWTKHSSDHPGAFKGGALELTPLWKSPTGAVSPDEDIKPALKPRSLGEADKNYDAMRGSEFTVNEPQMNSNAMRGSEFTVNEPQMNSNAMRGSELNVNEPQMNSNAMNGTDKNGPKHHANKGWEPYEALNLELKPAPKNHDVRHQKKHPSTDNCD